MSKFHEMRDNILKYGNPYGPKPKPSAEIIPLPTGGDLAIAKEDRTSAEEISRALEEQRKAAEAKEAKRKLREAERKLREEAAAREAHERRIEAFMNSQDMFAAAQRFNNSTGYYRQGDDW